MVWSLNEHGFRSQVLKAHRGLYRGVSGTEESGGERPWKDSPRQAEPGRAAPPGRKDPTLALL